KLTHLRWHSPRRLQHRRERANDGTAGEESFMAKAIEALVGRISRNKRLDIVGQARGATIGKFVKPGPVKDLLSGTWLAHALHPLLTDLPIGSFTSAMALDLLGGEDAAAGAQTLI